MSSPVLDYSDFVETACEEKDGCYESWASSADVERSGSRFIDPRKIPEDPFAVSMEYRDLVLDCWFEYNRSRDKIFGLWHYSANCPHCKTKLHDVDSSAYQTNYLSAIIIRTCNNCGWWELEKGMPVENIGEEGSYSAKSVHRRAILREFSVAGSEGPIKSLRQHIIRHPKDLQTINPHRLEKLVSSVFSDYMACEAIHVGGPNDDGIDIVLIDGDRRFVVQVKRREHRCIAEAISGIREFVGAMVLQGVVKGIFVTTAERFSPQAVATARKAKERKAVEFIELVNADRLIDICKLSTKLSDPPWAKAFNNMADLRKHIYPGFSTFMSLAMGHPEWKVDMTKIGQRPNK